MSRYCEKSTKRMYRYIDREVTFIRRMRIRIHLRRCPPCADGYDFEFALKDRIRTCCYEPPPEELRDRLRTFLREHGAGQETG